MTQHVTLGVTWVRDDTTIYYAKVRLSPDEPHVTYSVTTRDHPVRRR